MEESIWKMLLESLPFMSKALLWGIVIGFLVYVFMKLYARFERIEIAMAQLIVWVHGADNRFTTIDNRFVAIENRFIQIDNRFIAIEHRFVAIETRIQNLEIRVEKIEMKLDSMEEKFDKKFDTIIALLMPKEQPPNLLPQSKA